MTRQCDTQRTVAGRTRGSVARDFALCERQPFGARFETRATLAPQLNGGNG